MTLPGFTAQTSLYKSNQHYQGVSSRLSSLPRATVSPATFQMFGLCCEWYAGVYDFICGDCLFDGDGGWGTDHGSAQACAACYHKWNNNPVKLTQCLISAGCPT
jgi:hypothetical protein